MVAAVLTNAQCYGSCEIADCHPAQSTSQDSCHHHQESPPPSGGVCPHQHATVAGPEDGSGLAKPLAATSAPLLSVLVTQQYIPAAEMPTAAAFIPDTSPPGDHHSPSPAQLRI
jgi:hypothetical protein